ncbi:hypothetical protein ACFQZX_18000 [Mucilaginibacter litoreus]|uniref:Peptidase M56 domain-containing protein n=1 Tax=Mucilaginibacter litoreus TaxID=1048221 RepID=A0ABW3AX93_9SPHI
MGKQLIVVCPFMKVSGMALFPFILVKDQRMKHDQALINHERIHLRQQAELLVLPFYVLYLLNYLANLGRYGQHNKAYLHIAFEKEAYNNEQNLSYLNSRKAFSWLRYF